jgi:general L-amino acid transport system permease protein
MSARPKTLRQVMRGRAKTPASLLHDAFWRDIFFQVALAAGLVLFCAWLIDNTLTNLENQGKSLGFDFLFRTAGFQISQTFGT